jgi:hypothetical protein
MNLMRSVHLRVRGIIIPQAPHLPLLRLLPPPPPPPPIVSTPSYLYSRLMVSSSFTVRGRSLRLWPLHEGKPSSYLLVVWKSYIPP